MTKIIGLTGGIGSGKTTVAKYFSELGVPVYIADDAARIVMNDPKIIQHIRGAFGNEVVNQNQIDRRKLATIVFNDPDLLQKLNEIVHPAVGDHFSDWLSKQNYPFVIKEAAILFESGSYADCDAIITVTAPLETRITRVMSRDNSTREEVIQRINNQWTDEMRISKSDYVIENVKHPEAKQKVNEIAILLLN